jgi:hypothetical protein
MMSHGLAAATAAVQAAVAATACCMVHMMKLLLANPFRKL